MTDASREEPHTLNKLNIALDGPAGAGKSTIARLVAARLGYIYIDTGAMYRAVTYKALQLGLTIDQPEKIVEMAGRMKLDWVAGEQGQRVIVDGEDVTEPIRSIEVNRRVSLVSQIAGVRELLTRMQQQMAARKGVVMDGRDIGTHVLPDADVKVFLTASVAERAQRRFKEMQSAGQAINLEQLEADIAERDRMDEQREISPLIRARDAVLLDCTTLSINEVVERILELCRMKADGGG
jgi:cytidylate kinase